MRLQHWFKLDIVEDFKTREHEFMIIFFKTVFLVNLIKNRQYFLFQLTMKKIQVKWNLCYMLLTWNFNKNTQIVVALAARIMHLYTLGNMLLQGIFTGGLNSHYIFKNMATQ